MMEQISEFHIFWTVDGTDMVGYDINREEAIRVNTGSSHWKFTFNHHEGMGRVRVGNGCDYNPFDMIEQMRFHLLTGMSHILIPLDLGKIEMEFGSEDSDVDFDSDFQKDWD